MKDQGMQMFCSRRNQAGLIHEVQIAVINGEIISVKYTFYLQNPPESYEAQKGDEDFWKKVEMAVFLLACEPEVHEDMWAALSPKAIEILGSHDIFRGGPMEKINNMTPEEFEKYMEREKKENLEVRQFCDYFENCSRQCTQSSGESWEEPLSLDDALAKMELTLEEAIKYIPSTDPILRWIKGESLL